MSFVNEPECEAAGVDPDDVRKLLLRLERAAREAERLGLEIFGGSGTASLRGPGDLVVGSVGGPQLWDGGAGDQKVGADGLMRGERD